MTNKVHGKQFMELIFQYSESGILDFIHELPRVTFQRRIFSQNTQKMLLWAFDSFIFCVHISVVANYNIRSVQNPHFIQGELEDLFWVSKVICFVPAVHANQVRRAVAVEGRRREKRGTRWLKGRSLPGGEGRWQCGSVTPLR